MKFALTLLTVAVFGQCVFARPQNDDTTSSQLVSNQAVSLSSDIVTWFSNICASPAANGIRIPSCNLVEVVQSTLLPNSDDPTYFSYLIIIHPAVFEQINEVIGTYTFVLQDVENIINTAVTTVQSDIANIFDSTLNDSSNLDAYVINLANSLSVLVAIITSVIDAALISNLSNVSAQTASTLASSLSIVFTFVNVIFIAITASGVDTSSSVNYPIVADAVSNAFSAYSDVITQKSSVVIDNEDSTLTNSLPEAFVNFNGGSTSLLTALVPVTTVFNVDPNTDYTPEDLVSSLNQNVSVYSGAQISNEIANLFPYNSDPTATSTTLTDIDQDFSF